MDLLGHNRKGILVSILETTDQTTSDIFKQAQKAKLNLSSVHLLGKLEDVAVYRYHFKAAQFGDLGRCTFNHVQFVDCRFGDLCDCSFYECSFKHCSFFSSYITITRFNYCNFKNCGFYQAQLDSPRIEHSKFNSCRFRRATFNNSSFAAINFHNCPMDAHSVVPPSGSFIAYKYLANGLAILRIPAKAARLTAIGSRKSRASQVEVLAMFNFYGSPIFKCCAYHRSFTYQIGKNLPDKWDGNPAHECSYGIHFYMTLKEVKVAYPGMLDSAVDAAKTWLKEHKNDLN